MIATDQEFTENWTRMVLESTREWSWSAEQQAAVAREMVRAKDENKMLRSKVEGLELNRGKQLAVKQEKEKK